MRFLTSRRPNERLWTLALGLALTPAAFGASLPGKDALATSMLIEEDKDVRRGEAFLTTGYYRMSSQNIKVSGIEFDAGYHYAQSESFGFGPRLRQAFSYEGGLVTLFTGMVLDFNYAITGSLLSTDRVYKLDDYTSARVQQHNAGGLIGTFSINQFFINTSKVAVPFSGVGIGLRYDLPTDDNLTYTAAISVDRVTNTEMMVIPMQLSVGLVNSL